MSWKGDIGWHAQMLCVGDDPELFFPLTETAAVRHGETDGVWGATTASQRRAMRRAVLDR
ncbi:hypothetical protein ACWER6_12165 [Streptomyces sp. NPDC004009]